MNKIKELFMKFWNNKKLRDSLILLIMTIIFIVILVINLKQTTFRKSVKSMTCKECGAIQTRAYIEREKLICNKCKSEGKMGYSFKCIDCDYEFVVTPIANKRLKGLSKKERIQKNIYNKQCPNCLSTNTCSLEDHKAFKNTLSKVKKETAQPNK